MVTQVLKSYRVSWEMELIRLSVNVPTTLKVRVLPPAPSTVMVSS